QLVGNLDVILSFDDIVRTGMRKGPLPLLTHDLHYTVRLRKGLLDVDPNAHSSDDDENIAHEDKVMRDRDPLLVALVCAIDVEGSATFFGLELEDQPEEGAFNQDEPKPYQYANQGDQVVDVCRIGGRLNQKGITHVRLHDLERRGWPDRSQEHRWWLCRSIRKPSQRR